MRLLVLLRALSGCGFSAMDAPGGVAAPDGTRPVLEGLDRRIHLEVNRERSDRRIDALEWSAPLAEVAQGHSRDMARRDYFSHQSPEGLDPSGRARNGGVNCRIEVGDGSTRVGVTENLYVTTIYESVRERRLGTTVTRETDWFSVSELSQNTVQSWLDSPGHRRNVLDGISSAHGIGAAVSADDRVYITQVLC